MDKKDIGTVIVCLILLFLWFAYQGSLAPPIPNNPEQVEQLETSQDQGTVNDYSVTNAAKTDKTVDSTVNTATEIDPESAFIPEYSDLPEASPITLTVEDRTDFTIDPEKGGITGVTIHEYHDKDGIQKMHLGLDDVPTLDAQNRDGSWKFSHAKIESVDREHLSISRAILGTALVLEQSWKIQQDHPYDLNYVLTIKNLGTESINIEDILVNCGTLQPLDTAKGFMGAGGIDQRADALLAGKTSPKTINVDKISGYDDSDREKVKNWRLDWLAVQNKYFVSLISGEVPFSGCNLFTIDREDKLGGSAKDPSVYVGGCVYLPKARLDAGKSHSWQMSYFSGPKKYDLLKKLGQNKESILQFDLFLLFHFKWMKGISLGILWSLIKLEGVFHNYGVAIIIITILIRAVFWPITHQTTVWSKKMREIQPLAQEIRDKYKNDPQKMQQKTMELYRQNKINPVAGCLPMVLQIPVFFALFNVLRSAIELRQAKFLWAADLSQQDSIFTLLGFPVNPLAILMGLTMVWQQKVVPTSADPMQQRVMMFMTIFFVFILYSMPSGLTLYWSINQIVSIFQHKVTGIKKEKNS